MRSLTVILDEDGREICVLYRQFDGYPAGHGAELRDLLLRFLIVDGFGPNTPRRAANGMGCLAVRIVAHFKKDIGGFYLHPPGTRDCGEEFIYTIYIKKDHAVFPGSLFIRVQAGAVTFFGLPGTKQSNMPVIHDGLLDEFDPQRVQDDWGNRSEDPPNDFLTDRILSADTIEFPENPTPASNNSN